MRPDAPPTRAPAAAGSFRILVVEDDPDDVFLLEDVLAATSEPPCVVAFETLGQALEHAMDESFDLVLADLNLPDSQGLETLSRLVSRLREVPVVVLSDHDDEVLARQAVAQGAQDYIVKGTVETRSIERALRYARERHAFEERQRCLERDLAFSRKFEAIGQLAAGIAHEINTPTQYVSDNVRFLSDSLQDVQEVLRRLAEHAARGDGVPARELASLLEEADADYLLREVPRALEQSLSGLTRIGTIVRAMKEFSHPSDREKAPTDLNRVLEDTILVASNEWKYVAEVAAELDPALPAVPCVQGEIQQVFLNLLVNAAHAVAIAVGEEGAKGRITVRTRALEDGSAEIVVADTGTGISERHRDRIFDPYFTTKDVGRGTGQGLAIAYKVVAQHGGSIGFDTELGKGTTFRVVLPGPPDA